MNDNVPMRDPFAVTPRELKRMLSAVKPIVQRADVGRPTYPLKTRKDFEASRAELSFNVVRKTEKGFEGQDFRLGYEWPPVARKNFYEQLIKALEPANKVARSTLNSQFDDVVPQTAR